MNDRQHEIEKEINNLVNEYFSLIPDPEDDNCPLAAPLYGAEEVNKALTPLLTQEVTMGKLVTEFENKFAKMMGSKHAIMVNSGSSANLLALSVLVQPSVKHGLRPGDEVIVPAVTWATTVAPILQLGLVPVIVDIDEETLNINVDDLEAALTNKTRAIMPVHLLGNPVNMIPLMSFAYKHDLWVVEDTCESLGSEIAGKKVGSFGAFGTFSFYFSHHISTIEGGMLVTDDDKLNDLARSLRAHGWSRDMSNKKELEASNPHIDPLFLFVNVGYNLRPMETQAAFGLVQLEQLDDFNNERRENANFLNEHLKKHKDKLRVITEQEGGRSTWFGFSVITRSEQDRKKLSNHLRERGIATRPIVAGNLALQPAFRDNVHRIIGNLDVSTRIGEHGLFIGNYPGLTQGQLEHIIKAFDDYYEAE